VIAGINLTVTVSKADPAYKVPENLTASVGVPLSTVPLPAGWSWISEGSVGEAGVKAFKAKYTPSDINNYNIISNIDIFITVRKAAGFSLNTPLLSSKTESSITVKPITAPNGQAVEYAIGASALAPSGGWQTETTFVGLKAEATYYIFARTRENEGYSAGAISEPLAVETDKKKAEEDTLNNIIIISIVMFGALCAGVIIIRNRKKRF
jgi:hypothetical protein